MRPPQPDAQEYLCGPYEVVIVPQTLLAAHIRRAWPLQVSRLQALPAQAENKHKKVRPTGEKTSPLSEFGQ